MDKEYEFGEIKIRPVIEADIPVVTKIYLDIWKVEYREFIPGKYLDSLRYEYFENVFRLKLSDDKYPYYGFVAEINNEIVGFCFGKRNFIRSYGIDAELDKLYVVNEQRGKGISIKLLEVVLNELKNNGFSSVMLWTFQDAKSKTFYESLNGRLFHTIDVYHGGKKLKAVGFTWKIDDFLANLAKNRR